MSYYIFARTKSQKVIFVGCSRTADIPADSILLQTVEHHPDVHWVKWSVRFRRTLTDQKALTHPYARYFKNSARTARLYGNKNSDFAAEQNEQFLKFHKKNPHFMDELIRAALAKKAEGRNVYSLDQLMGDVRWGDTEIDRGADRFKINGKWSAWYSRALQMVEPRLVGFFAVRSCAADALEWTDGRNWPQFASLHGDEIQWSNPFDDLPDSEFEYWE
jgi:hypothetical protein